MSREGVAGIAGLGVGVVLATGCLGDGGRSADALFIHSSLVGIMVVAVALGRSVFELLGRTAMFLIGSFFLFAYATSAYRYSTLLNLADMAMATAIFGLARVAWSSTRGRRFVIIGLVVAAGSNVVTGAAQWLEGVPVRGLFPNAHHGAALVAAVGLFLLAWELTIDFRPGVDGDVTLPNGGTTGRVLRLGGVAVAAFYVVGIGSRGGTVALIAGVLVILLATRRRLVLAGLGICLVVALVLPTPLAKRVRSGSTADLYAYDRIQIWAAAGRMAVDHFWTGGVGLGSYEEAARAYRFPVERAVGRYAKHANHAHNEYLQLLAEGSLPALLFLLLPVGVALVEVGPSLARRDSSRRHLPAVAGATALLVHSLFDVVLHTPVVMYALALFLAMLVPPRREEATRFRPVVVIMLVALWGGGVLYPWLGNRALDRYEAGDEHALGQAIALVPGHASYQLAAATVASRRYFASGSLLDLDDARFRFDEACRLNPVDPTVWAHRALFYHRVFVSRIPTGELAASADANYREAIARDPDNVFLRGNRAALFGAMGELQNAADEARIAVELEPNFRNGHALLANALGELGDRYGALQAEAEVDRIDDLRRRSPPDLAYERAIVGADADADADAEGDPTGGW